MGDIFISSVGELKKVRTLATVAMLIAIKTVLDMTVMVYVTPQLRVSFGYLAMGSIGMLFGPVPAALAGACTDVISHFLRPAGAYFPGYTVSAMLGGLIYGFCLYRSRPTFLRALTAKLLINVIVNIGLNTLWLSLTGGGAMLALLPARAVKNGLSLIIEVPLLFAALKLVNISFKKIP